MTLKEKSQVKTDITSEFHDHDFLYDSNTFWISTGHNKGDNALFVQVWPFEDTDDLEWKVVGQN